MEFKSEVTYGIVSRKKRLGADDTEKYMCLCADEDECNYLYPAYWALEDCKKEYAKAHMADVDDFIWVAVGE